LKISLILDDEEEKSIECYRLLKKLKRSLPDAKERIVSMCFSDDRAIAALQASDLFAYFTRAEARRRFFGRDYAYKNLFPEFNIAGRRLRFEGGLLDREEIAKYQTWHNAEARKLADALRAKKKSHPVTE
jgi:superfamily I DNA and RNA helicase